MADGFTKQRMEWLDAVLTDAELSDVAFKAAYLVATKYLNRTRNEAWPSISTLARDLGRSTRRAQAAISSLISRGHLTHKRGGPGHSSRYSLSHQDRTKTADQGSSSPDANVTSETGRKRPVSNDQTGHKRAADLTKTSDHTGRKRPTNPVIEPIDEPFEKKIYPCVVETLSNFDEFWRHYPRKVSRGNASKAFMAALNCQRATSACLRPSRACSAVP